MRIVLQRVQNGSISVEGENIASIKRGIVAFVGFSASDVGVVDLARMAERMVSMRIFDDESGRMNKSIKEVDGSLLIVPQFTLTAKVDKGTRPSFHTSAPADIASNLFNEFVDHVKQLWVKVEVGVFGENMLVSLDNDGPVTFLLE